MNKEWEELIKTSLKFRADNISLSEHQSSQILRNIHLEKNRRNLNMLSKGKKIFIAAAAIVVLGAMTAIGAGNAVGYRSSINTDEVNYNNAEEFKAADTQLGAIPKAPQTFSDGSSFTRGYMRNVEGIDENDNVVESLPTATALYGDSLYLNIRPAINGNKNESASLPVAEKDVAGVHIKAYSDQYLFLPPDVQPSETDLALMEEGKLYISYGTEEEEREVYQYINWEEDGLSYSLSTFNESYKTEDLMAMAEEVLAVN